MILRLRRGETFPGVDQVLDGPLGDRLRLIRDSRRVDHGLLDRFIDVLRCSHTGTISRADAFANILYMRGTIYGTESQNRSFGRGDPSPAVATFPVADNQPIVSPRRIDPPIGAITDGAPNAHRTLSFGGLGGHLGQRLAWSTTGHLFAAAAIWANVWRGRDRGGSAGMDDSRPSAAPTRANAVASR